MPERFDHIPGDPEKEPSAWPPITWIAGVLVVLAVSAIVFLGMLFVKSILVSS